MDAGSKVARDMAVVRGQRLRRGTPRSRNGCVTCKIRRIKCDEARPACLKCSSTGRNCDGYVDQRSKDTHLGARSFTINHAPVRNPYLDFPGSKLEHRFLAFFHRHTAPTISGCFDSDFWNKHLPLVGQSEPTIQHAMIAVAAVHARLESMDELFDSYDKLEESRRFEVRQYNKAVHHLRRHIMGNGITIHVTLLCCLLLICLEFMRGSIEQAILHLQAGIDILHAHHSAASKQSVAHHTGASPDFKFIAPKLRDMFHRLRTQLLLCGRSPLSLQDVDLRSSHPLLDKPFCSLDEARSSLNFLSCLSLRFIDSSNKILRGSSSPACSYDNGLWATGSQLRNQLEKWSDNFEDLLTRKEHTRDLQFTESSTLLRMFYLTGVIWLSSSTSSEETIFDHNFQQFASIVALASSISSTDEPNVGIDWKFSLKRQTSFGFEMGIIAPLYFTTIACRDRKLRWKALSLLSSIAPRKEGLWDADILSYVARRVVEIEETGLDEFVMNSPDADLAREAFVPPEQDRVFDVTIHHEWDWQHEGKKGASITFVMKSTDGSENWIFRKEEVVLDSDSRYKQSREAKLEKGTDGASKWCTAAFVIR